MDTISKRILFGLLLIFASYFAYDFHFKYVINDYQAKQIEQDIQENFRSNKKLFQKLIANSREFGDVERLEFLDDNSISFQLYDSVSDRTESGFIPSLSLGKAKPPGIGTFFQESVQGIEFSDSSTLSVYIADTVIVLNKWLIFFDGKKSNPLVEKLLSYNGVSPAQLQKIEEDLKAVNCSVYDKRRGLLSLRFVGHWGEGFEYIIKTDSTKNVNHLETQKLDDNIYWNYYQIGIFCGWTDW